MTPFAAALPPRFRSASRLSASLLMASRLRLSFALRGPACDTQPRHTRHLSDRPPTHVFCEGTRSPPVPSARTASKTPLLPLLTAGPCDPALSMYSSPSSCPPALPPNLWKDADSADLVWAGPPGEGAASRTATSGLSTWLSHAPMGRLVRLEEQAAPPCIGHSF
jgi:hypothetical protein